MKKSAFIAIPITVLLAASMITTLILMRVKPNSSHVNQAQKIAAYSKPAVVRVFNYSIVQWKFNNNYDDDVAAFFEKIQNQTLIGGSGSGAIISSNGYIVTNAHVVELSKLDDQKIADEAFAQLCAQVAKQFNVTEESARQYLLKYVTYNSVTKYLKVILPNSTISLDGEVKSYGAPVGEGKDVAIVKIEGKNYPTLIIGNSENVQLQDSIWLFGYPGAADSEILSPNSATVVSITDGKISAVDKKSAQGAPVLQISAAATHGNSGGPVIDEKGNIIGLLTFRGDTVNGQEVQGFNFAVPSETIMEFVNQSGAKNETGDVDKLYRDGLELYWGGYYKDALTKFEQVQRLNPNHSEIKKFITDSEQNSAKSKTLWSKYKTTFIAYDAAAGLIVIVLIIFVTLGGRNVKQVNVVQKPNIIEQDNINNKTDV